MEVKYKVQSCFHMHKCKEVADNEIVFASLRKVVYEVLSCFYLMTLQRFLEGRDHLSRFNLQVPAAGYSGLALDLQEHDRKNQAESPNKRALRREMLKVVSKTNLVIPFLCCLNINCITRAVGGYMHGVGSSTHSAVSLRCSHSLQCQERAGLVLPSDALLMGTGK